MSIYTQRLTLHFLLNLVIFSIKYSLMSQADKFTEEEVILFQNSSHIAPNHHLTFGIPVNTPCHGSSLCLFDPGKWDVHQLPPGCCGQPGLHKPVLRYHSWGGQGAGVNRSSPSPVDLVHSYCELCHTRHVLKYNDFFVPVNGSISSSSYILNPLSQTQIH